MRTVHIPPPHTPIYCRIKFTEKKTNVISTVKLYLK